MELNELISKLREISNMRSASHFKRMVCKMAAQRLEAQQARIAQPEAELKEEMYRHDRVQDFEVAEAQELAKLREGRRWIPVGERLPESGVHVLVACEMRGRHLLGRYVCDGFYVKARTQPSYGNPDECAVEYSEEDDEYYLLEGWYEVIKNWDDFNSIVIGDYVTHWKPLPEPPKEGV